MDLLIDDAEKIIPIEVRAEENFRAKVWRCTEKNMIRLFVSERLWQITETKITDSSIWILCDIKGFWKFPKLQEEKIWPPQEVASRDFVRHNAVQIAWWWNIPTPFWFCQRTKSSKSLPSQKSSIANFKVNDYSFNRKICKTLICAF